MNVCNIKIIKLYMVCLQMTCPWLCNFNWSCERDIMRHSQGRAQSRNSIWSMATSPLCPTERCEWRWIWKVVGIRPRKMVASLQPRTLVASGRHTTASWEFVVWRTDAHRGVDPSPVWSSGSDRKWNLVSMYTTIKCLINYYFNYHNYRIIRCSRAINSIRIMR